MTAGLLVVVVAAPLVAGGCTDSAASPSAAESGSGLATPIATSSPAAAGSPEATASAATSPSALWSGAPLTTKPMSPADAAEIDGLGALVLKLYPDMPGLWLGVWDPVKGFYSQAYGNAVKGGEKAAVDQHGRIGSVTKTFTTTAILQQVAAGSLKLESTIGEVLPELAAKYPQIKDITVERLADMTSGIPDYGNTHVIIDKVQATPTRVFTPDELIDAAMTLPLAAPGTGGYSTTNTIILGKMLERLTGKPVDQVLTEVAASVGLSDTALTPADQNAMPAPSSHGYVESDKVAKALGLDVPGGTDTTDWTMSWGQAGGGMYSTVEDMGKWAATGLGTSLLPADLGARRLVSAPIPEAKGGYGMGIEDFGNGWIGHTGQVIGWESIVLYNPTTGAAFVAIVNGTSSLVAAELMAAKWQPTLESLLAP